MRHFYGMDGVMFWISLLLVVQTIRKLSNNHQILHMKKKNTRMSRFTVFQFSFSIIQYEFDIELPKIKKYKINYIIKIHLDPTHHHQ